MADDDRTPLDEVLEVVVFAPVGLFLAARDAARQELPKLIEAGRAQITKQVALARMMGHYAVEEAQKDADKRVQQATDLVAAARERVAPTPSPDAPAPATPTTAEKRPPSPETFPEVAAPLNGSAPEPGSLAIPGYGSLSASQVVQRLAGLSAEQLEAVRNYESTTRGRKTVLGRIAQLQSDA